MTGQVVDFGLARAIKTAKDALTHELAEAKRLEKVIDWAAVARGEVPRWPGGIDDLEV